MSKQILGLLILMVACINIYWSIKIHSLMNFQGDEEEMSKRKKKANRISNIGKISYIATIVVVGAYIFFNGGV